MADYFTSTVDGSSGNPGTEASPKQTIAQGLPLLSPGDRLIVRAGSYNEFFTSTFMVGGSSWTLPKTIMAYPGETVIIKPLTAPNRVFNFSYANQRYIILDGLIIDAVNVLDHAINITWQSADGHANPAAYIRIINCEVKNANNSGIVFGESDGPGGCEAINCHIHHNGSLITDHGVYIQSPDCLVELCDIHNHVGYGVHNFHNLSTDASRATVRRNRVYLNGEYGILLGSGDGSQAYYNLVYRNGGGIMARYLCTNAKIYNNTCYKNTQSTVYIGSDASGTEVKNHISYLDGSLISNNGTGTTTATNFLVGDPLFNSPDAAVPDFRLKQGSLAIEAGTALGLSSDFSGALVGVPPNQGAYEDFIPIAVFLGQTGPNLLPTVRILNAADFTPVMELEQYSQLTYTKRWQDLDEFEVNLSGDSRQGKRISDLGILKAKNMYVLAVYLHSILDFAGLIDVVDAFLDVKGNEIRLSGMGLDRIFSDRTILPPFGEEHDVYNDLAESAMKSLVDRQIVNPIGSGITGVSTEEGITAPDDKRALPQLTIEMDGHRGSFVQFNGRFQRVDLALQQMALGGGVGYSVEVDEENHAMIFRVSAGNDRTASIIFDPALGNVKKMEYSLNGLETATAVIMAGQGEGIVRVLYGLGGEPDAPVGLARREIFMDMRDLDSIDAMISRGKSELARRGTASAFTVDIKQGVRPFYKTDWELGDIITIRNSLWGIEEQVRVVEVEVTLEAGKEVQIRPQFARPEASLGESISKVVSASATNRS